MRKSIVAVAVWALFWGCFSPSSAPTPTPRPDASSGERDAAVGARRDAIRSKKRKSCVPGRSVPCACPDGRTGVQTCRPDGTFGQCRCSDRRDVGREVDAQLKRGQDASERHDGGYDAGRHDVSTDVASPCECSNSGMPCCDGCKYLDRTKFCAKETIRKCFEPKHRTCGAYIGRAQFKRYCSGQSVRCNGRIERVGKVERIKECPQDGGGIIETCENHKCVSVSRNDCR